VTNRASLTAEYMALFRALESRRPAKERLFSDPYAPRFLQGWRKWLHAAARFPAGLRFAEGLLDHSAPGARAAGIARTKWLDDETTAALRDAKQLVLLGAGFDMRSHRLPAAAHVTTFELDHPFTAQAKQAMLKNLATPGSVRYVAIDFSRQSIAEVLTAAGFDNTQPACFIWEGVTNYLTPDAIDGTLQQIRQTTPGNLLLFTYIDRAVLDHPDRFFGAEKLMSRLQSYGEPWTFGIHPAEIQSFLAVRGFELVKDLGVADVWEKTRGYEFYRLASARVKPR
jgi:methyltransferase (TIGR00027 family)